ncbi:single-stranded DNA-binding protein [Tatumella sp. UBA2305]|uniref:single-stranded DNA-binding protein n=1 Tax=Tatumella sp. UBA2305 TaxID=1947647 RepID=UPI0025D3E7B5|nr:single-stranded DNA-binding protein [Tatumella sp. UBA2305]
MTAQISSYGRLVADPQTRTTANGKSMAMARLAVALPCHTAQNNEATYWLGVVAFGTQADILAKHQKGDMISVAGNMQLNQWSGQDGVQKEQPQVIADSIVSAKTVRPGGRKTTSSPQQSGQPQNAAPGWDIYQQPHFDD